MTPGTAINDIVMRRGSFFAGDRLEEVIVNDAFARARRINPGDTIGVTRGQAFWVVLIVVAAGAFGTWLVWGQPALRG